MANREIDKIPVDKDKIMSILDDRNISIRELGPWIGWNERSIRRGLNSGAMSPALFYAIVNYIEVDPSSISAASDLSGMSIQTHRVKNVDGSYSVVIKFTGSDDEIKKAMELVEQTAYETLGRKPDMKILNGGK